MTSPLFTVSPAPNSHSTAGAPDAHTPPTLLPRWLSPMTSSSSTVVPCAGSQMTEVMGMAWMEGAAGRVGVEVGGWG